MIMSDVAKDKIAVSQGVASGKPHATRPWLLVVGAVFALALSSGPLFHFAFAVFIIPLSTAFQVDRATVSIAASVALLMIALATPALGWLTDRVGSRYVVLVSAPATAIGLLAMAFLTDSIAMFITIYALVAVISLGTSTLPYVRAVTRSFDRRRGLALGFTMAGIGVGVAALPPLCQALIAEFGWRGAYTGLALLILVVAWPAALLLPRERADHSIAARAEVAGLTVRQSIIQPSFIIMTIAFMLAAFAMSGVMAHMVALLGDRGVAADRAASILSIGGIALIFGRIIAGYLLDRIFAPRLAIVFFLLPLSGLLILLLASDPISAWIAVALIGLGIGAEVDLIAFMVSRYFGLRAFGAVYGLMLTGFMVGNAAGPITLGLSHRLTDVYDAGLIAGASALALASLLMLALGSYRYPGHAEPGAVDEKPAESL
jgi:MFS family permease